MQVFVHPRSWSPGQTLRNDGRIFSVRMASGEDHVINTIQTLVALWNDDAIMILETLRASKQVGH